MKNILRNFVFIVWAVALLPVNVSAQNRRDKEQTYVLEQPYDQDNSFSRKEDKKCHSDDRRRHESYACIFCMDSQPW